VLAYQMKKAEIAMMRVGIRALQLGAAVSKPIFEGARYDYIIEREGKLYRAQVKYADGKPSRTTGAVYLNLRKQIKKNKNCPYNDSEIDALVVYVPKIDKICWFGPEIFSGKQNLSIRIAPTKSGRIKGCLAADDYLW
jgi:PD-(D/E)XK nuclease superfamily protein